MSVAIENGSGFINIRNDIGTVKFKDNGVFETVNYVGWIDDTTNTMSLFKRNTVYTLAFLRSTLTTSTTNSQILFSFKNGYTISGTPQTVALHVPYNDLCRIPFTVKSIRCTVVQPDLPMVTSAGAYSAIPDLRPTASPEEGTDLSYYNVLHDNKEILNGRIVTEPSVSVSVVENDGINTSSHIPTTQDTFYFAMKNDGYGTLGYEFTMDFIYDNQATNL